MSSQTWYTIINEAVAHTRSVNRILQVTTLVADQRCRIMSIKSGLLQRLSQNTAVLSLKPCFQPFVWSIHFTGANLNQPLPQIQESERPWNFLAPRLDFFSLEIRAYNGCSHAICKPNRRSCMQLSVTCVMARRCNRETCKRGGASHLGFHGLLTRPLLSAVYRHALSTETFKAQMTCDPGALSHAPAPQN